MRKSKFKQPKTVLVFNGARVLIAIIRSLHTASNLTGGNAQAISFCCTGKYVSTGGLYFRHIHPEIEIEITDLDTLRLDDYDEMCSDKREYHTVREMAKMRKKIGVIRQNIKKNKKGEGKP